MIHSKRLIVVILMAAMVGTAAAQSSPISKPQPQDEKGYTAYAEFGGTANSDGQVYRLDSSIGYNFSKHFGADLGLPIYFVRASSTTGSISNNSFGNPYLDLRLKFNNPAVNYGSVLTGFVPAADSKRGMSTGRGTFDWTNHFDHSFSRLTPFLEAGIANTIIDSEVFIRPYTTLGFNGHFQGGANFDLWKFVSVGASAYDILPFGQQTVFSKVAGKSGSASNSSHGGVFETSQQTTGSADIAKDNGYSAWIRANPNRYMDLQLGYTRSVHYALNSVFFGVGFNLGALAHRGKGQ
jgi:hypothetical protein